MTPFSHFRREEQYDGAKVWFHLVDAQTRGAYGDTQITSVSSDIVSDFEDLREAVKEECPNNLAGVDASDLNVYTNLTAYDDENGQPLEEDLPIGALGASKKDAVTVEVPERPRKRQKTMWTTTVLDLAALTLPDVDDCKTVTWSLDAALISGFGIYCRSDKLVLFYRLDVVELLKFMQNGVYAMVDADMC
ncbi:hypothetical protein PsorP6_003132 [Peronosclerospora sorghi]|uniref:Uncharacterized protein n=1 Tax=Peronosclerospora sorghi TaxID=230839 RepID=A0ACC0VNV0_9STRA|nr:hypothetical protein PsorP6_003132 [Peronosclerospora sorghi]